MVPGYMSSQFSYTDDEWPPSQGGSLGEDSEAGSDVVVTSHTSHSHTSHGSIDETEAFRDDHSHGSSKGVDEEPALTPRSSVVPTSVAFEQSLPGMFAEDIFAQNEAVIDASLTEQYYDMDSGPQILFSSIRPESQHHSSYAKLLRKALVFALALGSIYWTICVAISVQSSHPPTVVLSPVAFFCNMPLISIFWSKWPCGSDTRLMNSVTPDFPALARVQARALQTIIDEATGMTEVGWKLWKSEKAIVDLLGFIGSSELDGKDILEGEFKVLITQVSSIEEELATLGGAILTAADRIIAVNTYALDVLGSLTPHWYELVFPSSSFNSRLTRKFHENFRWTVKILSESTGEIMMHCKATAISLNAMEGTLTAIHDIIKHERTIALDQREELQAAFWTRLGGNKGHLGHLGDRLTILSGIEHTHSRALKHVHRISEGVLHMQRDVSNTLQSAFIANRPESQLTAQAMRSQLLDVAVSMARVVSSMVEFQKKSRDTRREPREDTRQSGQELGFGSPN